MIGKIETTTTFFHEYIVGWFVQSFCPKILREINNRFGGRIGVIEMAFRKMIEIDSMNDLRMCSVLMKELLIENLL